LREPEDAAELASRIKLLASDERLRSSIGARAAQTARNYSWEQNAAALQKVLVEVAKTLTAEKKGKSAYRWLCACGRASTAWRVAARVKPSVSFGMEVMKDPSIQPRPAGMSRVTETTSLCT